jgi:hypothetical protein
MQRVMHLIYWILLNPPRKVWLNNPCMAHTWLNTVQCPEVCFLTLRGHNHMEAQTHTHTHVHKHVHTHTHTCTVSVWSLQVWCVPNAMHQAAVYLLLRVLWVVSLPQHSHWQTLMPVYRRTCMHTYSHTHTRVHTHMYTCTQIHTCTHAYTHVHTQHTQRWKEEGGRCQKAP